MRLAARRDIFGNGDRAENGHGLTRIYTGRIEYDVPRIPNTDSHCADGSIVAPEIQVSGK